VNSRHELIFLASGELLLVAFTSDEGIARFARAVAKVDFPLLANQFEAQANVAFCGPAIAAMLLNAIHAQVPAYPVIAAACLRRTFANSRADSIRQSHVSRRIM
jgi:Phytochelatin synthase